MRLWLKNIREGAGYTLKETGEKLGISESYYWTIENGQRQQNMKIATISKLAEIFGITTDEIIKLENEYQQTNEAGA